MSTVNRSNQVQTSSKNGQEQLSAQELLAIRNQECEDLENENRILQSVVSSTPTKAPSFMAMITKNIDVITTRIAISGVIIIALFLIIRIH